MESMENVEEEQCEPHASQWERVEPIPWSHQGINRKAKRSLDLETNLLTLLLNLEARRFMPSFPTFKRYPETPWGEKISLQSPDTDGSGTPSDSFIHSACTQRTGLEHDFLPKEEYFSLSHGSSLVVAASHCNGIARLNLGCRNLKLRGPVL